MKVLIAITLFLCSYVAIAQPEESNHKAEPFIESQEADSCQIYIPNISGIAHQAINSVYCLEYEWGVYSNCELADFHLVVYNRWGERVYESVEQDKRWDAYSMHDGVYVYILKYTNEHDKAVNLKGHLTLLR